MAKQLFRLSDSGFRLPLMSDVNTRKVETLPAGRLPLVFWPDGRWCYPANAWMLKLWEEGHSRRARGGTLATYCACITPLLRYCFSRTLDFHKLNDAHFTKFILQLREEKRTPDGPRSRSDNSVLAIGRACLDFLQFVAELRSNQPLISADGPIRAKQVHRRGRTNTDTDASWHHNSFPTADPMRKRFPITEDAIAALKSAVLNASGSVFRRVRRYEMLRVLEITGGRRMEVALLRVEDVINALNSPNGEIRLFTAKRRGGKEDFRYIPVSKIELESLMRFIQINRRRIIRKTVGVDKDHGYVFINERTGAPLLPNTITLEIHFLAKQAQLPGVTSPHMFRHRFITKIFVKLIREHDLFHKDDLRRLLVSTKQLMQKLQQWTGHRSLDSLERYIDLAFAEVEGFRLNVRQLRESMDAEAISKAMVELALGMKAGQVADAGERLEMLSHALDALTGKPKSDSGPVVPHP